MKSSFEICFVIPVQSPYVTERLKVLAAYPDLQITLLLERASFSHRPGWQPEPIGGIKVKVIGSAVFSSESRGDDLGYTIQGIRSIPLKLLYALWCIRPDVVVVCNATQLFLVLPSKWLLGVRLALMVEDTPHSTRNLGSLMRMIKGWLYRRADGWFSFSEDATKYLAQIGINNAVVRSSWSLDMKKFQPASISENCGSSSDEKAVTSVLFIGQLISRKGIMHLLEAWYQLPLIYRSASKLIIVGDGPLREQINGFIHEKAMDDLQLLGQRPYSEVRDLLVSADLLVLPTLEDVYSLTVVEAMACGCPVITTPFAGAHELITEGENGWLVDPTQPGALAGVLEKALSSKSNLHQMGQKARARVVRMDNTIVMEEFAEALRKLATGNTL